MKYNQYFTSSDQIWRIKPTRKEYLRDYQLAWMRNRKSDAIKALGGCCKHCGSTTRLEFDHIDPATKITHLFWSWSKKRMAEELAKCQLLCRACHEKKTASENSAKAFRPHGHYSKYKSGCRCDSCRAANVNYMREWRAKNGREGKKRVAQ